MLQENSTAYINGMRLAANPYISLILYESSHANISNSTFGGSAGVSLFNA